MMQLASVLGSVTATQKHASLRGQKLLVVQPRLADGRAPDGNPLVAVDTVGAGPGEDVIITSDGRSAREYLNDTTTPVRWTVIGIRDA